MTNIFQVAELFVFSLFQGEWRLGEFWMNSHQNIR